MASPMQPSNEPVAISNPITSVTSSILVSPSITSASESSPSLLKPSASKPDPSLSSIASAGLRTSPSASSPGLGKSRLLSPPPMATATNSASHSLNQERGQPHGEQNDVNSGDSRNTTVTGKESNGNQNHTAQDGSRAANTLSDPMVAKPPQGSSDEMQVDNHLLASPASMSNTVGATGGENATPTTTLMNNSTVASPGPIEESNSQEGQRPQHREDGVAPEEANKSFSYPVPMGAMNLNDPRRGMSLPHSGFHKGNPRSPSAKKHRCPYCSTEFTRHHNLKSHLLTHSQEKPYVCQTCQSRFRRLHDLKRHTKLHTGERPHICPQCGRKFARGDALARHNKGQGGCAGRRSSMGSYAGEDEYGDGGGAGPADDMDGLMYTEPDRMDEEDERQSSMPSIKKPNNPSEPIPRSTTADHNAFQSRQPSTYPPIAVVRPQQGGLFPPTSHGSSSSTSPISQPGNMSFASGGGSGSSNLNAGQQQQQQQQQGSPSIFSRATMRESPKPLSPNQSGHGTEGNIHSQQQQQQRPRSPSINQQYQQQYFGRGSTSSNTNHNSSSTQGSLGLPPPHSTAPQLPPPPGLNPPDSRYTLHSQGSIAAQQSQTQHAQQQHPSSIPPTHSHSHSQSRQPPSFAQNPNSENSNHHNNTNNTNNNLFAQPIRTTTSPGPINSGDNNNHNNNSRNDDRIWMYIRSLEEKVDGLQNEVIGLRSQIATPAASGISGAGNSAAGQTQDRK